MDKSLVSTSWLLLFPRARLRNLGSVVSDHSSIELNTNDEVIARRRRIFRFENKWLREPDIGRVVMESWELSGGNSLLVRLKGCSNSLDEWDLRLARQFKGQIEACKQKLYKLQHHMGI